MWRELTTLWQSVRDPEYAHLLLESLPLYGLAFGLVVLVIAFLTGERKSRFLAIALMGLSCASVWPYIDIRLSATPRIIAVRPVEFRSDIEKQTQRRQDTAWAYYTMAGLCAVALAMQRGRYARHAVMVVVLCGMVLFWISVWLHHKESELYHPNILPGALSSGR